MVAYATVGDTGRKTAYEARHFQEVHIRLAGVACTKGSWNSSTELGRTYGMGNTRYRYIQGPRGTSPPVPWSTEDLPRGYTRTQAFRNKDSSRRSGNRRVACPVLPSILRLRTPRTRVSEGPTVYAPHSVAHVRWPSQPQPYNARG